MKRHKILSVLLLLTFGLPAFLGNGLHLFLPHEIEQCVHSHDFHKEILPNDTHSDHSVQTCHFVYSDHFDSNHEDPHDSSSFCFICVFNSLNQSNSIEFFQIFSMEYSENIFPDALDHTIQKDLTFHSGRSPPPFSFV